MPSFLKRGPWLGWHRPVDANVFATTMGNNHDSVLFVEPELKYPYHLIVSHTPNLLICGEPRNSHGVVKDWELVSDQYKIGNFYEYDDGVKVDGTYYIYEGGKVFTYSGPLEDSNGKWKVTGSFPHKECDDIGFTTRTDFSHVWRTWSFPTDRWNSLAHFTSKTGLGDWEMVNPKAVDPNPKGGHKYGVGDATIVLRGNYYIYCDRESQGSPYKVTAWRSRV